jgi:hypothetical protein
MSKCRSCGAEIRWVMMDSGRKMPLDVKRITIIEEDPETGAARIVSGYQSHFSTCPNADMHRRSKK